MKFHTHELSKLKRLIRSVIITELTKIETRKQSRRWRIENNLREAEDDDEAEIEKEKAAMAGKSGGAF